MAQTQSPYPYFTIEEYYEFEERSQVKHEYVDGQLYALAGASARHNQIIWNLVAELTAPARAAGCTVAFNDLKVHVTENIIYYPDLIVVCDPTDNQALYRTSPCLVVEVLSPSTAAYDRREKLFAYRQISALQTYLIIWQDEMRVQRHFRDGAGGWANGEVSGTGLVPLPCPDITLTLDQIYRDIDFSVS